MGEVYLAHDTVLNIDVAVKVLPASLAELGAARLQREAIALARLGHPNIARVIDFSQTKEQSPYMVMEYIKGESLDQMIKRQKVLDLKTALSIFTQVSRGLEFAHSTGVIHRDLKPSNIMLVVDDNNKSLQAKILDFGIAKVTTENQKLTSTGSLIGSPLYMSPEHSEGIADQPPSDIYSLGCLMFECLTGVPPLKGANSLETISFHRNLAPPLISDIKPELNYPKDLINLVDECLRKTPQTRPQTAKEVENRLNEIKQSLEIVPNLKNNSEITNKKPKFKISQSQLSLIAVCALVIATLAAGIYAVKNLPKTDEKRVTQIVQETNKEFSERQKNNPFDEDVEYIAKHDGSVHVKIPPTASDDDFKKLKKGTVIFLVSSEATGRGFYDLTNLKLTTITIEYGKIEDQYCDAFTKFPLLRNLKIQSPNLTDNGVEKICTHKKFKTLHLKSNNITDKGASNLSSLKELESVTIASSSITPTAIDYLIPLKELKELQLCEINFSDDFADGISKLKNLEAFTLNHATIPDPNSWRYLVNAKINSLTLENLSLNKTLIEHILNSKNLERLEVNNCTFTQNTLEPITRNETLKHLRIFNSQIMHPQNFEDLRKSKLEILHLKNVPVTDGQALHFVSISTLKRLILENTDIEPEIKKEIETHFEKIYKRQLQVEIK